MAFSFLSIDEHQLVRHEQHLGELLPRVQQMRAGLAESREPSSNLSSPPAETPVRESLISSGQRN